MNSRPTQLSKILLSALALGVAGSVWAGAYTAPDIIFHRETSRPLWVRADAAHDGDSIRWELFDEHAASELRRTWEQLERKSNVAGSAERLQAGGYLDENLCTTTTIVAHSEEPSRRSVEDLVAHAKSIVVGRIAGISQGFIGGLPASLLTVEVDNVISASEDFAAEPTLWVAYPYAAFEIDGRVFCRSEPKYSYRPKGGDHVVLFPHRAPLDKDSRLVIPDAVEILVNEGHGFHLPEEFHEHGEVREVLTARDLRARIQSALSSSHDR